MSITNSVLNCIEPKFKVSIHNDLNWLKQTTFQSLGNFVGSKVVEVSSWCKDICIQLPYSPKERQRLQEPCNNTSDACTVNKYRMIRGEL